MTPSDFKHSLARRKPPDGLLSALVALWWAGKDDWNKAHQIVANGEGSDCAWVHAHLHRVEGDLDRARCSKRANCLLQFTGGSLRGLTRAISRRRRCCWRSWRNGCWRSPKKTARTLAYVIYCAPLAVSVEAVIRPASSEARNTTQRPISSGSPRRPMGIVGRIVFSRTSFGTACTISVLM